MGWIKYDECEPSDVCERFAAQCRAMKDTQKSLTARLPYSTPRLSVLGSIDELTGSGLCDQLGGPALPPAAGQVQINTTGGRTGARGEWTTRPEES